MDSRDDGSGDDRVSLTGDNNKNTTSVIVSNGNAFLICVTVIFICMAIGFAWVYRDYAEFKYQQGVQDEQIRQVQNIVFLGDPYKEQERIKKKWLMEIIIEAQKEGLLVGLKEENK